MYQVWTGGDINGRRYWDGNQRNRGISYFTLQTFAHSIIVHMTFIDISCSTFVDLILGTIITSTLILTKANDNINQAVIHPI